jgi:hypothetical protein
MLHTIGLMTQALLAKPRDYTNRLAIHRLNQRIRFTLGSRFIQEKGNQKKE